MISPPVELVKRFVSESSPMDALWEFAGKPEEAILLGSGMDLDSLVDWPALVGRTPGTIVVFNLKTFDCLTKDRPCLIVSSRAHINKVIKRRNDNISIVCLVDQKDIPYIDVKVIRKVSCPIMCDMMGWISSANNGKVWKLSTGFAGACVFAKKCSSIYIGGFDGYMGIPRKKHRWHSDIPGISGKHHDYNSEFFILMAIAKQSRTEIKASIPSVKIMVSNGVLAREWA